MNKKYVEKRYKEYRVYGRHVKGNYFIDKTITALDMGAAIAMFTVLDKDIKVINIEEIK